MTIRDLRPPGQRESSILHCSQSFTNYYYYYYRYAAYRCTYLGTVLHSTPPLHHEGDTPSLSPSLSVAPVVTARYWKRKPATCIITLSPPYQASYWSERCIGSSRLLRCCARPSLPNFFEKAPEFSLPRLHLHFVLTAQSIHRLF